MPSTHNCSFRVYYEDTDAGGVVYYANYLKFAERARTEMLRDLKVNQSELIEKQGLYFVVRHVEADLKKPARLDDMLEVNTEIEKVSGASLGMVQKIIKDGVNIVDVKVQVVCIDSNFKPARIPADIADKLKS